MCGINGVFCYSGRDAVDAHELRRTRDYMVLRGPDSFGEWISNDGRVGFGHRRLAIVDLSPKGAQPMHSADGAIVVTFNGEIYNYLALRRELEAEGCIFQSHSDTEVLIHLYCRRGLAMLKALRGMFAFALSDAAQGRVVLARDPYGIKPLYYSDDGKTLRFASSVKAILAGGAVSSAPDPAGVAGFYVLGAVPEPFTTIRAIRMLPAGSAMVLETDKSPRVEVYASIAERICKAEETSRTLRAGDIAELFRTAFRDSVAHHLMADVPVGAFLSAGVDSGAVVGLMRDAGQSSINTITLAFEEYRNTPADESIFAELTARRYATNHTTRFVSASEFEADLPKILHAMDQPTVDGINTWFVSKAAAEQGLKVAMSGVGGDELLGGYNTTSSIPRISNWFGRLPSSPVVHSLWRGGLALARMAGKSVHPKAAGFPDFAGNIAGAYFLVRGLFLPSELSSVMEDPQMIRDGLQELDLVSHIAAALRPEPATTMGKIAALESGLYLRNQLLRDTDWTGMAHSLEIRTPFVDFELLDRLMPLMMHIKPGIGKKMLAVAPTRGLPDEVLRRSKTGFGTPLESWLRNSQLHKDRYGAKRDPRSPFARAWAVEVAKLYSESVSRP